MKKFLASGIFCFLALNATLNAQTVLICDLKVYLEDKIYCLNNQLNDMSFDQNSNDAGYLFGQKIAYEDVYNQLK